MSSNVKNTELWCYQRNQEDKEVKCPLHRRTFDLCRNTSVEQLLERSCREPAGQYNVMGVWLWTLNNFICSEYSLCTAGFVQRQNSLQQRHLVMKVATRHFKYYFRVFNQIVKRAFLALLINWAVNSYKSQCNNLFISEETGWYSFFALA